MTSFTLDCPIHFGACGRPYSGTCLLEEPLLRLNTRLLYLFYWLLNHEQLIIDQYAAKKSVSG